MFEIYLFILLPSFGALLLAIKGLSPAGIEFGGRKLSRGMSAAISLLTIIGIIVVNAFAISFLFFAR